MTRCIITQDGRLQCTDDFLRIMIDQSRNEPDDAHRIEKLLAEYERAQEVGHHTDTIIHEVTAIVWGADTLLMGFILEVSCESNNQLLVIVTAIIGILMSMFPGSTTSQKETSVLHMRCPGKSKMKCRCTIA